MKGLPSNLFAYGVIIILHTKLHIPQPGGRNLLERPELFEWLNEGLKVKLTAVMAPTGYGKTTALSMWSRQSGFPTGWVSLDRYDNDLVRFWKYVAEAVHGIYPEFCGKAVAQLASAMEDTFRLSVDALLNELNALSGELALILDDFHVIDQASIHTSIAYFLEYLPSIERTIALPDGVDPGKITTAIVIESDGTVRHVPTKVALINGQYKAIINSLTNSTYALIFLYTRKKQEASHEFGELMGGFLETDWNL